tara:strand:- start:1054 stop:1581 length:528 start_codon:yes stop_codon:yes gene_type:complete
MLAIVVLSVICQEAKAQGKITIKVTFKSGTASWGGENPVSIPLDSGGVKKMEATLNNPGEVLAFYDTVTRESGQQLSHGTERVKAVSRDHSRSNTIHKSFHHVDGTVDHNHNHSHHHTGTINVNYNQPIGRYRSSCGKKYYTVYPAQGGGYRFYNKRWYYSRSWSYWNYSYFYRF